MAQWLAQTESGDQIPVELESECEEQRGHTECPERGWAVVDSCGCGVEPLKWRGIIAVGGNSVTIPSRAPTRERIIWAASCWSRSEVRLVVEDAMRIVST